MRIIQLAILALYFAFFVSIPICLSSAFDAFTATQDETLGDGSEVQPESIQATTSEGMVRLFESAQAKESFEHWKVAKGLEKRGLFEAAFERYKKSYELTNKEYAYTKLQELARPIVTQRILSKWKAPSIECLTNPRVEFTVIDGRATDIHVPVSSGHPKIDNELRNLIESTPQPILPGHRKLTMEFDASVTLDLAAVTAHLRKRIEEASGNEQALLQQELISTYLEQGAVSSARKCVDKLLLTQDKEPNITLADSYRALAKVLDAEKNYSEAFRNYGIALDIALNCQDEAELPRFLWRYGKRLCECGYKKEGQQKLVEAERIKRSNENYESAQHVYCFSVFIAEHPTNAYFYRRRGLAYLGIGKPLKAMSDFDKVLELHPEDRRVYFYRGWTMQEQGKNRDAIDEYTKDIKIEANSENLFRRAECYREINELSKALQDINKAIALEPNIDRLSQLKGQILHDFNTRRKQKAT